MTKSVVADLVDVNKLVEAAIEHAMMTIKIRSISPKGICFLVMFTATAKKIMNDVWAPMSLLRRKTYEQGRRTPSRLGAELIALSRALAEARWMRSMWLETMYDDYDPIKNDEFEKKTPLVAVVDRKPLFDRARSSTATIKDKRHAIEMHIVRDELDTRNIHLRWVATYQLLGDISSRRGVFVWIC